MWAGKQTAQTTDNLKNAATPFFKGHAVQPKLQINEPGDVYEKEADNMADRVMRMPDPLANKDAFFKPVANSIQRKCHSCEQEEDDLHRKESNDAPVSSNSQLDTYVGSLNSSGQPLSATSRQFFEPRFGQDFSDVRIHTDSVAAKSAQSINALAYTTGNNIVFNAGQYSPETPSGKKLMAHELTHVVQQNSNIATKRIQRLVSDFDIKGISTDNVDNVIFFDVGSAAIDSTQAPKIAKLAKPVNRKLTLIGTSSEEGTPGGNLSIINQRINAVDSALFAKGQIGKKTHTPQPTAGEGNLNYRSVRAVEVIETPAVVPSGGVQPVGSPPCAVTAANPNPQVISCGTSFTNAFPIGKTWITETLKKIDAKDPAALSAMATLFAGITPATLRDRINNDILPQYLLLQTQHQCHNSCDGGCSRPAYNSGSGTSSMMTLCSPGVVTSTDVNKNAETLVHENLHATPGLTTADTAYNTTRLIVSMAGDQALHNTDSWVLLFMKLGSTIATPVPATDTFTGIAPGSAEEKFAKTAMAFLEQWLLTADFDTSLLYNGIVSNIGRAGGWDPADSWNASGLHSIAWLFGMTDPGAASPFLTSPVNTDKVKMAGIHDRYLKMREGIYLTPIAITKSAGPDQWAPNIGNSVTVTPSFFTKTPGDSVLHLLRLLIQSMSSIPSSLETAYDEGANQLRWHRGCIGP